MAFIPTEVQEWMAENREGEVLSAEPVGGGCIHNSIRIQMSAGGWYILKFNPDPPPGIFSAEAAGLKALDIPEGPTIPEVYLTGETFLLLEDLQPAPRREDFWIDYGRKLAQVHLQNNQHFGFEEDNYIGSNPQRNSWMENGLDFFKDQRLSPQIRWGMDRHLLSSSDLRQCEILMGKLEDMIPEQPSVLIHGDLWSGNLITDLKGKPALIDPAVYYGWAEADLAMTDLFGSYPDPFYDAYQEVAPLCSGFKERYPLYNLYHMLNHLNLFGSGYLPGVREILGKYA